jgi:putative tryptophan/tyrosine transport system substrate-binding protein
MQFDHLKRRDFITLLAGAAAWPPAARAQQAAMPVIGFLHGASASRGYVPLLDAFRQGLKESGFVEGQNVAIEYRWAEDRYDRLPALAADLVQRQVTVIFAGASPAAQAAKRATTTIPIVFSTAFDPVATGLVENLARPGGNVTGVTDLNVEVGPKRLELLIEAVPKAATIAALLNPTNPGAERLSEDLQAAARMLGIQLHILHASAENDFDAVFADLSRLRIGGLVIGADALFNNHVEQVAALALRHAIPAIYGRDFAIAGGLMSYGGALTDTYHLGGIYTGRILKGEKPAGLPVQQSSKIELIINLRTAKALGITFPVTLLGRADEVVE